MAKKRSSKQSSSIFKSISEAIFSSISGRVSEGVGSVIKTVKVGVIDLEEQLVRRLFASILIGTGIIIGVIGGFRYLMEFTNLSDNLVYLLLGLLFLFIGFAIKYYILDHERRR